MGFFFRNFSSAFIPVTACRPSAEEPANFTSQPLPLSMIQGRNECLAESRIQRIVDRSFPTRTPSTKGQFRVAGNHRKIHRRSELIVNGNGISTAESYFCQIKFRANASHFPTRKVAVIGFNGAPVIKLHRLRECSKPRITGLPFPAIDPVRARNQTLRPKSAAAPPAERQQNISI